MDDLADKFKKMAAVFKPKPKFKGKAHKLGAADEPPPSREAREPASSAAAAAAHQRLEGRGSPSRRNARTALMPAPDPRAGDGGSGAYVAPPAPPSADDDDQALGEQSDALNTSVALLVSLGEVGSKTIQTLVTIVRNVINKPSEPKYRQLRRDNARIATLLDTPGALAVLQFAGFQDTEHGSILQLPDPIQSARLEAALQALVVHTESAHAAQPGVARAALPPDPAAGSINSAELPAPTPPAAGPGVALNSSATSSAPEDAGRSVPRHGSNNVMPQAPAGGRQTTVLLPVHTDVEVPDWFFERTGAELKADYARARKHREESQILMTKRMREQRAAAGRGSAPTEGVIRVRFPEGVILQGQFHGTENVQTISTWVDSNLRGPVCFELLTPDPAGKTGVRKPLPSSGTVAAAGLLPSCVLNFRCTDLAENAGHSFLSDEALKLTKMEE